jgi:hypothetical protein
MAKASLADVDGQFERRLAVAWPVVIVYRR